jgi:hypothetical protein
VIAFHAAKGVMVHYLKTPEQSTLKKYWMGTNLKLLYGVGSPLLFTLFIILVLAVISDEEPRIIFILLSIFWGTLIGYMYYTWKSSPMRYIHFRGMQIYSSAVGSQAGISEIQGRPINKAAACLEMALQICGREKYDFVNEMLDKLKIEKGNYFKDVLQNNYKIAFPNATDREILSHIRQMEQMDFGPTLVIAYIIEKSLGEVQAVRYISALKRGELY